MKRTLVVIAALVISISAVFAAALPKDDLPSHKLPFEQVVGDNGDYETLPGDYPRAGTYNITVDVTNQIVTVYNSEGEIVRQCLCSTGTKKTPTPLGTVKMENVRKRFSVFTGYASTGFGQYMSKINKYSYFHSLIYSKKDANTWTSTSYRGLGKRMSHGCIRLPVPDARWIYFNVAPGTEVTVTDKIARDEDLRKQLALPPIPKQRPKGLGNVAQIFADGTTWSYVPQKTPQPAAIPSDAAAITTVKPLTDR